MVISARGFLNLLLIVLVENGVVCPEEKGGMFSLFLHSQRAMATVSDVWRRDDEVGVEGIEVFVNGQMQCNGLYFGGMI